MDDVTAEAAKVFTDLGYPAVTVKKGNVHDDDGYVYQISLHERDLRSFLVNIRNRKAEEPGAEDGESQGEPSSEGIEVTEEEFELVKEFAEAVESDISAIKTALDNVIVGDAASPVARRLVQERISAYEGVLSLIEAHLSETG